MIKGSQISAARALVKWSQSELSERSGIPVPTIKKIEHGAVESPRPDTLTSIINAFENVNVVFTQRGGVEFKDDLVKIFEGKDGFIEFFNEVYNHTRKNGGEILVRDVDDRMLHNVLGDAYEDHPERMQKLTNFTCRTIIRQGDNYSDKHDYASFAKVPDELFSNVPLYVFGQSVGIFFWNENPKILMITDADLVKAYTKQFDFVWKIYVNKEA